MPQAPAPSSLPSREVHKQVSLQFPRSEIRGQERGRKDLRGSRKRQVSQKLLGGSVPVPEWVKRALRSGRLQGVKDQPLSGALPGILGEGKKPSDWGSGWELSVSMSPGALSWALH